MVLCPEIDSFDLDGEDMFPEFVEHGIEVLRAGEIVFVDFYGQELEEVTEHIEYPQDAAYYILRARGLHPEDPVTIDFKLTTALAAAIARKIPNWPDLHPEREPREPPIQDFIRYYREAA
jgi:hypothetical protein